MIAVRDEIGARVDALALAHEGDDFVTAVRDLADELDDEGKAALQQVLLERAADEEDFQQAVRQRFAEKGWTRRTLAKLERRWRDDRSDTIAAALTLNISRGGLAVRTTSPLAVGTAVKVRFRVPTAKKDIGSISHEWPS